MSDLVPPPVPADSDGATGETAATGATGETAAAPADRCATSTAGRHAAVRVARPGPELAPWVPKAGIALGLVLTVGALATASGAATSGGSHQASSQGSSQGSSSGVVRRAVDPQQLSAGAPAGAKVVPALPIYVRNRAPVTPAIVSGLAANGIPNIALNAYRVAAARMASAEPSCGISWPLLAGIGRVESDHGQYGGAVLRADGTSSIPIIGPALDGNKWDYIADTDGGRLDGDPVYDHAVGPMQFIPSTWAAYGADADGDGVANPFDINDAALGTARYLCAAGGDLRTAAGQQRAVLAYNHSDEYLALVLATAAAYAAGVPVGGPISGITTGSLPAIGSGITLPANPGPLPGLSGVSGLGASPTTGPQTTTTSRPAPASQPGGGSGGSSAGAGSGSGSGAGGGSGTTGAGNTANPTPQPSASSSANPLPIPTIPGLPSVPVAAPSPVISTITGPVSSAVCTVTTVLGALVPCPTPTH